MLGDIGFFLKNFIKNYIYQRIWLCQHFDLYKEEIINIEYYIEEDIGNNSAWNYRYFLLKNSINKQSLKEELLYR